MKLRFLGAFFVSIACAGWVRAESEALATQVISAGQRHELALRSDGTVWSWGTNRFGELGQGTNSLVLSPRRISSLSNMLAIAAGPQHSLAVSSNGTVWAWGTNVDGRLGTGSFSSTNNPVAVSTITNAITVVAGATHSLAALSDGRVMAWGANNAGQLGTGNTISTNKPVFVDSFTNVIAVAAGTNFSLALTASGDVWAWGTNNLGQLGLGNNTSQTVPVKITSLSNIVQIAAGHGHALARNQAGQIFAWGRNAEGQIGNGTTNNVNTPTLVSVFGTTNTFGAGQWVSANFNSSAAISEDGRICYWGYYNNGWTNGPQNSPVALGAGIDEVFETLAYGDGFLLASESDGSVWAWGNNSYGQWGNNTVNDGWPGAGYEATNPAYSFSSQPHPRATRFNRGNDANINYNSFVLPVDLQKGVELGAFGSELYNYGADAPWFLKIAKTTRTHVFKQITGTTNVTRFNVDNPLATYGSAAGGSPLYVGQPTSFGVFGGCFDEKTGLTNMIRISVYDRAAFASGATNVTPTNVINIPLPRRFIAAETNRWTAFITNGYRVVVQTNGLRTAVEFMDRQGTAQDWGLYWNTTPIPDKVVLGGYRITHLPEAQATNYYYMVEVMGSVQVASNTMTFLATTNGTGAAYQPLYAMDFETLPEWRSSFIDTPHFEGIPLPPTYAGKTKKELDGLVAVVTNNIWITNNAAYTNLDGSPELRQHPVLDQFVEDMGRDPLALTSYVINEIELVDPLALTDGNKKVNEAIEPGGVARSALGTFLEGQGSPAEQCALLVYLLRRAGYSAGYVFPTNNNLRLLDTRVSQLWQMQVKGVIWAAGTPVVTDSLIQANYPWVVANIGTNSVQIFPWLKDTEIVEGQDIYDYMPTNYPAAYHWIKDFIFAKPELMSLANSNSSPAVFWQKYLESILATNQTARNLSLDDFGVRAFNRRHLYPTWDTLPLPNYLTNQADVAVIPTLTENTNTYPFLSGLFERIRFQVFKTDTSATNLLFDTGEWRVCDLQNRRLLLYTNSTTNVTLYLSPYRSGLTNLTNFTNFETGTNSLNPQQLRATVGTNVTELPVIVTYKRRVSTFANSATYSFTMPMLEWTGKTVVVPCRKGGFTALVFNFGRVSTAMLRLQADDYWRLERQRAFDPNFAPPPIDDPGIAATMLGLGYLQKATSDNELNARLHKIRGLSTLTVGRAAMTPLTNGLMQIGLSMYWSLSELLGNGSLHEESSGDLSLYNFGNYRDMLQLISPAAEHGIINTMFGDNQPISAVRVLQIVSDRARANGWSFPLEVTVNNYTSLGDKVYTGYGPYTAAFQDWGNWLDLIPSAFRTGSDTNFLRVLISPGLVSVTNAAFNGSAVLFFDRNGNSSTLSSYDYAPLNAGLSSADLFAVGTPSTPTYELSHDLNYNGNFGFSFSANDFSAQGMQFQFSFSSPSLALLSAPYSGGGSVIKKQVTFTPQQGIQGTLVASQFSLSTTSTATAYKYGKDVGYAGPRYAGMQQKGSTFADPVQAVSGDFYSDTVDLSLAGPMPFQLRRSYLSRNLADNQLGYGWRLGFMPWLVVSTNAAGIPVMDAAEMDGALIAYRYQSNNLWTVEAQDNPTLVNFTEAGIGGRANQFNNRILQDTNNSGVYILTAVDGNRRTYQVMTNFAIVIGTNHLDRIRPYLTRWEDHSGNYYTFKYGTNDTANDFGQLNRVEGSSGTFLAFRYDYYGRIVEILSNDGRRLKYEFDDFGDLTSVTLPDNSLWQYEYDHYTFTTNSATYTDSSHLLTREVKPDGRILANTYDNFRRVVMQAATVGANRSLVTNAWIYYTNNCTSLTNDVLTGTTRVEDVFHNPTLYFYTSNLITSIIEPLGRTNIQDWFEASETNKPGYYPRSLELVVDPRGLTNELRYSTNGNLTSLITRGDLTGSGTANQSATNTFTFTTNSLPATVSDPAGNSAVLFYEDGADAWRPTSVVRMAGATPVATNRFSYTNVSEVVMLATSTRTNQAFGLLARVVRADSATNDWSYDGRGFPTQSIQWTRTTDNPGNADPAVTNYFTFTDRGDLAEVANAAGRRTQMSYDAVGRLQWREVLNESGAVLAREGFYYNRNGELEWYDGPRSNPDDFVHLDYDGAGRMVEEMHWRSRAKADGTGVEAETGDALYATTFHRFDAFGNELATLYPNRSVMTNIWDALGRLSYQKVLDAGGTVLTSRGFAYEPGGLVTRHTNALGGITEMLYTSTGQPRYRKNPDDSTNGWAYYLDGRLWREFGRNGAYAETTYDDANRKVTSIYYSATGAPLATNSSQFDARGNLIVSTDAGGNSFTNTFDGLDRLKSSAGPMIVFENPPDMPAPPGGPPPPIQQTLTRYFDAAGLVVTNVNGLGEKAITYFDALGRSTRSEIRSANNTLVRESSASYSSDHHSVTVTTGSGTSAIVSTSFTDNDGNPVLSISYPGSNLREFMRWSYAVSGDLTFAGHYSTSNGATALWSQSQHTYDGLHRPLTTTDRDNAQTTFAYNALGNLTNRVMPGGLKWQASYNLAGQMLQSWNLAPDNSGTRTNGYTYFTDGSPFAGLLNTHTDGRGVVCALGYDDFLRPTTNAYSGSLPEHNLTTTRKFDARGLVTEVSESFASGSTGPSTLISRSHDPYGQLNGETVSLGGSEHSTAGQQWDSAGRRGWLSYSTFTYTFGWQADGQLSSLSAASGWVNGNYSYNSAGLLNSRGIGGLSVNVTSRDGMGRPTARTSAVNSVTRLSETLSWTSDGLLSAHSLARTGDFTDARSYGYEALSRRLATERLKLNATAGWTNVFDYDEGTAGGPGVLTRMAEPQLGGAEWTAELDGFNRIERETNNVVRRPAQGRLNATSMYGTVSAALDGRALTVNTFATGDPNWPTEWRTEMELRPGTRTLLATAQHASRLFTTNASVTFTNNAVDQTTVSHFAEGQLSYRVWKNSLGQTNRVQSFTWDGRSRLIATTELDANNNGYNWSAVYDGFGRRLQTTTILVTNGVAWTNQPKVIASYFDPSVEFLEVGMKISGKVRWKIYGPDTDGSYGGMNGTGGFDGYVDDVGVFRPLISDARGDVHGTYDPVTAAMQWNTSRPTGYGAVPEYRPLSLADNGDLGAASAWHGRWPDRSGMYWMGARYYDPVAGRFISCDPYGHDADASLYAFAGGDPINYDDPNGFLAKRAWNQVRYGGGIALHTLMGMGADIDTMRAAVDINHPRHWEVNAQMGVIGAFDYLYAGGGWSGGRNAFNRYNPVRAPFEAVSGMNLMEGPELGVRLTGAERATQWASTVSLAASVGTGAPGTVTAVSADLRALSALRVPVTAVGADAEALAQGGMRIRVNPQTSELGGINISGANAPTRSTVATRQPIRAGEHTTYEDFVKRSSVGDNLEGHELWQHANINEQGLATTRLSTPASQQNPVIALDRATHQSVNAAQSALDARNMSPIENIRANANILRSQNAAPASTIDAAEKAAIEHAQQYGF